MKKLLALFTSALLGLGLAVGGASSASADPLVGAVGVMETWTNDTNKTSYWEARYSAHGATCYKTEADEGGVSSSSHGSSSGKTVTLAAFNPSWPGDHWEALIVKGGSLWNNVVTHPVAGTAYASPLNSGAQQSNVSHWIVCKGTTPAPPPVASAAIHIADSTCEIGQVLTLGAVTNASWPNPALVVTGPGAYSVTATATGVAKFPGNEATKTFSGTLLGPDGEKCGAPNPEQRVVVVEVVDCLSDEVIITTTTYSTPYVWNGTAWVLSAEGPGVDVVTSRDLTDEERRECPPGQPDPKQRVVVVDDYDCLSEDVTVRTTTYSTPYIWDTVLKEWVEGTEDDGIEVMTSRDKTEEEIEECLLTFPLDTDPEYSVCGIDDERTEFAIWVRVDFVANVEYRISGPGLDNVLFTSEFMELTQIGEYIVKAKAINGYTLDPLAEIEWTYNVGDSSQEECIPTLAEPWPANATASNAACVDGRNVSGAITVVFPLGAEDRVRYFVGETELTSVKTAFAPGKYTVKAVPGYDGDSIAGQDEWELEVLAAADLCTLALTGSESAPVGLSLGAGMLLLGALALYLRRRSESALI